MPFISLSSIQLSPSVSSYLVLSTYLHLFFFSFISVPFPLLLLHFLLTFFPPHPISPLQPLSSPHPSFPSYPSCLPYTPFPSHSDSLLAIAKAPHKPTTSASLLPAARHAPPRPNLRNNNISLDIPFFYLLFFHSIDPRCCFIQEVYDSTVPSASRFL